MRLGTGDVDWMLDTMAGVCRRVPGSRSDKLPMVVQVCWTYPRILHGHITSSSHAMATWFDVGMVKVMAAKRNFKCRIWKCFTLKTKNCLMRLDVEKIVGPNIWRTDFAESSRIPWRIYSTSQKLVKYLMSSCSHILPVEIAQNISFPRALRI